MHRTEGPQYETSTGVRLHKIYPPPGTIANSEYLNAIQEEMVHAIEYAGITINSTAALDRTDGWHQLRDAIFLSEAIGTEAIADSAITDDKVSDVDISKLTYSNSLGGADLSYVNGSDTYGLTFSPQELKLTLSSGIYESSFTVVAGSLALTEKASSVITGSLSMNTTGFSFADWNTYPVSGDTFSGNATEGMAHTLISGGSAYNQAKFNYDGINYKENGTDAGGPIKFRVFDFDGASWSGTGPYSATITPFFSASNRPLSAEFSYRTVATGNITVVKGSSASVTYDTIFSSSSITYTMFNDISGSSYDRRRLLVWYAS
jgi:hypothetical protein